jgi:hypothetical protein
MLVLRRLQGCSSALGLLPEWPTQLRGLSGVGGWPVNPSNSTTVVFIFLASVESNYFRDSFSSSTRWHRQVSIIR